MSEILQILNTVLKHCYGIQHEGDKNRFFKTFLSSRNNPYLLKLKAIQQRLKEKTMNDIQAKEEIHALILGDQTYPFRGRCDLDRNDSELILDVFLFEGQIFQQRRPDSGYAGYVYWLTYQNHLHLGPPTFIKKIAPDIANKLLVCAIANASVETALYLLEHFKAFIHLKYQDSFFDIQNTALMLAIAKGRQHIEVGGASKMMFAPLIECLLEDFTTKETVNIQDQFGMTALHLAVLQSDIVSIQKLLEAGADPDIKDYEGKMPKDYLGLTYNQAKEYLRAYTQGSSRSKQALQDRSLSSKVGDILLKPIFTMSSEKTWQKAKNEINEALSKKAPQLCF